MISFLERLVVFGNAGSAIGNLLQEAVQARCNDRYTFGQRLQPGERALMKKGLRRFVDVLSNHTSVRERALMKKGLRLSCTAPHGTSIAPTPLLDWTLAGRLRPDRLVVRGGFAQKVEYPAGSECSRGL
jgi:hypothetical protein